MQLVISALVLIRGSFTLVSLELLFSVEEYCFTDLCEFSCLG